MHAALRLTVFLLSFGALQAEESACPSQVSHIVMEKGSYSSRPGVTFELRHFAAALVPMGKTSPACHTNMTVVSHAEIFVSNESLTRVFADKIGQSDSNIKNLKIENGLGKVTMSGSISKVIPIQFTISGPVTTDGTALLLDASQIKADGVPVKLLLSMVGEHLGSVLGMKGMNGISVDENRMSFFPEKIAHLKGYIASVETNDKGVILRYGRKAAAHPAAFRVPAARSRTLPGG